MQNNIEDQLIGNASEEIEKLEKQKLNREIEIAQWDLVEEKITDINKIPKHLLFDKNTVYRCFNRENKAISFLSGTQAEALIQYPNTYVITFDHRVEHVRKKPDPKKNKQQ